MNKSKLDFRRLWEEVRWIVIGTAWLGSLLLGYIGYSIYGLDNGIPFTISERLYRSFQLISLESGAADGVNNLALEIARFLLPGLTAYTAFQAITHLFLEQTQWFKLWRLHDHNIICGFGRKGNHLVNDLIKAGQRVVVIDKDINPVQANEYRLRGVIMIKGDATDPDILESARISRAKNLICLLGQDQQNLKIAHLAYHFCKQSQNKLVCTIHLTSQDLLDLVKKSELSLSTNVPFTLETFNTYRRIAHTLLHNDLGWQENASENLKHIFVIGFGNLGRNLISQAGYTWHTFRKSRKLNISVLDRDSKEKTIRLLQDHPQINSSINLKSIQSEFASNVALREILIRDCDLSDIQRIYICLEDPILCLQVSLVLNQFTELADVPVYIRLEKQTGLAELLKNPITVQQEQINLIPFDPYEQSCTSALVVGGIHELLAIQLRENYLRNLDTSEAHQQLAEPWEEVPVEEKDANRQQANRICQLLNARGYDINPLQDWDAGDFQFPAEDIDQMAQIEHRLWCEWKQHSGWQFGEQRNNQLKTNPDIAPWEELPEREKLKNQNFIQQLPALLANMGFQIDRKMR